MRNRLKKAALLKFISVMCVFLVLSADVFADGFPDVLRTHKNYTAVTDLVKAGVIAGYEDGYFRPEKEITRTEFCALMARTLGYDKTSYILGELPFSDVPEGYWGEAYISFCYEYGLINGMGDGTFLPAAKVTAEQAIKMAVCAIGKESEAFLKPGEKWYSGYVLVAEEYNLLYKIEQEYGLPSVRGDIAQLVYNMVETKLLLTDEEEVDLTEPDFETEVEIPGEPEEDNSIPPEILSVYKNKDFSDVRTILIDAGHNWSGRDTGAENVALGLKEEKITWQIADKLRTKLEDMGYVVVMTRDKLTDSIANTSVLESLQARVDLGHESFSDLFISIHCNAGGGSGTEAYSFREASYAGILAEMIQKNITDNTTLYDRGTKTANFFVIKNTLMPTVLIETGFIDNEHDAGVISSDDGQDAIAAAIAEAVYEYDNASLETELLKYQKTPADDEMTLEEEETQND